MAPRPAERSSRRNRVSPVQDLRSEFESVPAVTSHTSCVPSITAICTPTALRSAESLETAFCTRLSRGEEGLYLRIGADGSLLVWWAPNIFNFEVSSGSSDACCRASSALFAKMFKIGRPSASKATHNPLRIWSMRRKPMTQRGSSSRNQIGERLALVLSPSKEARCTRSLCSFKSCCTFSRTTALFTVSFITPLARSNNSRRMSSFNTSALKVKPRTDSASKTPVMSKLARQCMTLAVVRRSSSSHSLNCPQSKMTGLAPPGADGSSTSRTLPECGSAW
mmetsp:Transcript_21072/g.45647  ORF Transcript_21072/g.45647 Transcript_21072/m.45647 type:complete len:280 (+) Transcript_21072:1452-2291(+)